MEPFRPTVDHAVAEYLAAPTSPAGSEPAVKRTIIAEA